MALHDWNQNGKEDGWDNMFDYQIFSESFHKHPHPSSTNRIKRVSSCKCMSTVGALLYIFSGLLWEAILFTVLRIDVDNVPTALIIFLWILFTTITVGLIETIKNSL